MRSSLIERVWKIAEPLIEREGMEIVDIEFQREARGTVLRFYLDREGGVGLDDLAPLSRRIGDVIEANDLAPGSYTLEVSSPGINRRLRRPDHFRRYVGKRIRVRTHTPIAGRRSFVGPLCAVEADGIVVGAASDSQFICFGEIAQANYEHDFAADAKVGRRERSHSR